MWKMLEPDFECGDECGGPGPPPEFLIPPPPRPPFLHDAIKCSEDIQLPNSEMCEAIPILDASFHSSPSFQTSAMIILCTVILVLVILISSLLVWKHKRKVQNFLPCKTPTRGHPLDTNGVSGHSVTYEDPDAHLGHHPLVRHHHNIEMIHPKSLHYPSGYPMTRSPPLFICSSPGPDPYRSHDNVYEELGPPRDSDGESDPPMHSDDDFAEDELSLPGDRSFQKSSPDNTTVATIYHERNSDRNSDRNGSGGSNSNESAGSSNIMERTLNERNALLSSSSSSNNNSASSNNNNNNNINNNNNNNNNNSSSNNNNNANNESSRNLLRNNSSPLVFRSRKIYNRENNNARKLPNYSVDELNNVQMSTLGDPQQTSNHKSGILNGYLNGDRVNIMTLPYPTHNYSNNSNSTNLLNSLNNNSVNNNNTISNIMNNNNNNNNGISLSNQNNVSNNLNNNRIDDHNQLNSNSVSTIYRDRDRMITTPSLAASYNYHNPIRSHTNPRSYNRDHNRLNSGNNHLIDDDQNYGYTEPVFHEGILYDSCHHPSNTRNPPIYPPYILPEFTTFRTLNNPSHPNSQIYSRDSSFGSDSGYSHHTQNSNRGSSRGVAGGFIGATFGWGKKMKNKTNKNNKFDGS